ncbi:hypothetical protein ACWIFB_08005 [Dietzia sp. NPDC055340]
MKLSAQKLQERTASLGFPVARGAIAKLENGQRGGKIEISELIVLAQALETSPTMLLWHDMPDGDAWYLPTVKDSAWYAHSWWTGESAVSVQGVNTGGNRQTAMDSMRKMSLDNLMSTRQALRHADDNPYLTDDRIAKMVNSIPELEQHAREDGWTVKGRDDG